MKTSTFELSVRVLFLFLSVSVAGCNKDEFYEKEYLENPFKPDEQVDGGVTSGGEAGTTDGSSTGGDVDGGSTGGSTDGSSTAGSTDGSTVGGSTVGSSTAGSTDGSSTAGSTDGSSTAGSTDGSSTAGSTNGSSTAGSTDGSSTGGTTVGSSAAGSTDGSSTGGSTTGSSAQWKDESFQQTAETQKKLDVIWVIDNSGSMAEEQASLGDNFEVFIRDFITKNVDFKMGVTTTDTRTNGGGYAVGTSLADLTSSEAQSDEADFLDDFARLVNVGIRGDGNEKGLQASESYINRYKDSWMRDDAYLVVVYLSDEEDQSPKTKEQYLASLQAAKTNAGYVKAYSIVNTVPCTSGGGLTCGFERYAYQADQTAGTVADIKSNFASVLQDMGQSIINLLDTFPLAHDPIANTIEVRVNGVVQASGWSVTGRQLKFDAGSVPAVGASVQVRYQY